MKSELYDTYDYCRKTSLYISGKILSGEFSSIDNHIICQMIKECRLINLFGHRRSKIYKNKLAGGLDCAQYHALLIYLYLTKNSPKSKKIAKNIFWGYVFRMGFSPCLTELVLFKPQSMILLFRMIWYLFPIYCLLWPFWRLWVEFNINTLNSETTTNKISLLPTLYVLNEKMPSMGYIKEVYNIHFKNNQRIGNALIKGLIGE